MHKMIIFQQIHNSCAIITKIQFYNGKIHAKQTKKYYLQRDNYPKHTNIYIITKHIIAILLYIVSSQHTGTLLYPAYYL